LLERSLVVVLGLSVKEPERQLLVLVSAFRCTLSSNTRSSVRDGVAERVRVRDSAVDGVRVFATGETEVRVVELGDGEDVHEAGYGLSVKSRLLSEAKTYRNIGFDKMSRMPRDEHRG
jgi:hypothetical protein